MRRPSVIASNRGPVSFTVVDGELIIKKASGGLASGLGPILADQGIAWVAAAVTNGDRAAAEMQLGTQAGFDIQLVNMDPSRYKLAYDVVANQTLWFMLHDLWDLPSEPRFDASWREAWDAYRDLNDAFATQIASIAAPNSTVLVQDYHLLLVGAPLSRLRPDLTCVHFSHTPFCGPDTMRVLPTDVATEILSGMADFSACGFHTQRWSKRFKECCDEFNVQPPTQFVSPLPSSQRDLESLSSSPAVVAAQAEIQQLIGDRKLLARVDRIELSKNILRGFEAFEIFLETHPEWHQNVVFKANCQPSREGVAAYHAYRVDIEEIARRINHRFGTDSWQPVELALEDNFPASLALLKDADAVLVNPTRDGLNLVAREAVLVNQRDAVLILSREAGIADELGQSAIMVNPFDVGETAEAIAHALTMDTVERTKRFAELHEAATARSSTDWLNEQLNAAGGTH